MPWIKYEGEAQDGVVVIGASITQNPLVTPAAMEGAPYYHAKGGWNAVLDRTDCITYGIGGQTTTNVANRFDEILKYDYKKIIIQCGNNDLGTYNDDQKVVDLEVGNYTTMLNKVKAKNDKLDDPIEVYIISLNPTSSASLKERIVKVNTAIEELSRNYDFVTYISIYDDFLDESTGASKTDLVMGDGLHPVAAGYKIWAQKLKTAMASDDKTDTSLVTLSYRMSDTEKKTAVTGFESTESDGSSNTYTVNLPDGTADDAELKLYVTPSNLSASITVAGSSEAAEDSYEDTYLPVALNNGKAAVEFTVTSQDNSAKETYVVNFTVGEAGDEPEVPEASVSIEVTDDTVGSWPYAEISETGQIYTGATVEYDVTVENTDFTGIYLETDFNWNEVGVSSLTTADFTANTAHITHTWTGDAIAELTGIQIKTGGETTDYRGKLTITNLKVTNGQASLEENTLFSGSKEVSNDSASVFTSGNIDMDTVTAGGYFYVEYEADSEKEVKLALSDWETESWIEISPTETGPVGTGVYYAKYSYEACEEAYGRSDFSGVDAISVKTADTITLTKLSWYGVPQEDDGSETWFSGSKTVTGATQLMPYFYTKHVGGEFDNTNIREDSYFTAEYTGTKDMVQVALASVSGAKEWVAVSPTKTETLENGNYLSTYSIDDCISAFGSNFNRLDQVQIYTPYDADDDASVTLRKLKFYPGTGALVDADGETK